MSTNPGSMQKYPSNECPFPYHNPTRSVHLVGHFNSVMFLDNMCIKNKKFFQNEESFMAEKPKIKNQKTKKSAIIKL